MVNEPHDVDLASKRHFLSGILRTVTTDEDDFIEVVVENGGQFRISYPLDTLEGKTLRDGLTSNMIGKKVLIYRMADLTNPLRIEIRPEGAHGSP